MSDKDKLQVYPMEQVDRALKKVSDDMLALREQVKSENEATGLTLDERKDDLAAHQKSLDEILVRLEKQSTELKDSRRLAAATAGDQELVREIKGLESGFRAPRGDADDYTKVMAGCKPTVKNLIEGVLLPTGEFYEAQHEQLQELQALNDAVLITDQLMAYCGGSGYRNEGVKSLAIYGELMRKCGDVFKGDTDFVDTDNISNWVPTHFSTQIFNLVKAGLPELNIFQEMPMPGKTFDLNVDLTDVTGDYIAETTTIAGMNPFADLNSQAIDDAKATLTAKKFRARVPFSGEADEDAIVAQMALIRNAIIEALREAKADAILNGDAAGNLDTGGTHYGRANPAAGVDPRFAFDGLRSFSADNTATPAIRVDIAGDATSAALRSMRETMGEWGLDPAQLVHLLGYTAYLNMLGDSNLLTMDKVGDRATLITGAIGAVNGSSVAVSRRMPQNMNVAGIMDGVTTNKTAMLTINRRGAVIGNRRRDTIGQDRYGATDSIDLFVFSRIGFAQLFGVTKPWLSEGYNVNL